MTYVVTARCDNCKYTDCVDVCPVDCFREGETMLYIDPDECIECDACVPACPVEAIFEESEVPERYQDYLQINADKSKECPSIEESKDPLPSARKLEEIIAEEEGG